MIVKTDGLFAALVETKDCLLLELTRQPAKRGDRNIIECRSSRCLASMGRRGNNNNISHHCHSATDTSHFHLYSACYIFALVEGEEPPVSAVKLSALEISEAVLSRIRSMFNIQCQL